MLLCLVTAPWGFRFETWNKDPKHFFDSRDFMGEKCRSTEFR